MEHTAKHFKKRDAILSCLRETHAHPSAETLHQMLRQTNPDISLATVYRNLALFKSQGMIQSLGAVQGVERFDGNTAPHVHYVCCHCGEIVDLPSIQIPAELSQAAATQSGGQITGCQLTFTGLCGQCETPKTI